MDIKLTQLEQRFEKSILTRIEHPSILEQRVELFLKRDDLLHPIVSGNKWRKLKYNLDRALTMETDTLISMGGAYSNHLHALAYTGKALGLNTIGIIRGEKPEILNPTLRDMEDWGMTFHFVSRNDFRKYRSYKLPEDFSGLESNQYWLPEGGANALALKGVGEIVEEIETNYDYLCAACGTGATLAGLINQIPESINVLGFSALKNSDDLKTEIVSWLTCDNKNWQLFNQYHFGGFAKVKPELMVFIQDFQQQTGIELEPIYTGKMLFGIFDLIGKGYFKSGSRIIALHTGGLQGNRGVN